MFKRARNICLSALLLLLCTLPAFALKRPATTTEGTEFWAVFANNRKFLADDVTLKIELHVVAQDAMTVVVADGNGGQIDSHDFGAGGGEFIFQLSPDQAYIDPILKSNPGENQQPVNKGVHVYADDPNAKFSCFGYIEAGVSGNTSRDAILFLPTTAWGKEYITQTYNEDATSTFFVVMASEDQTTVNITPRTVTFLNAHPAGATFAVNLNKGQSILIPSIDRDAAAGMSVDLSGSLICADKPVAVFNGNQETKIPLKDEYSGDHTYEQALASNRWGTEFYLARAGKTLANKLTITAAYDQTEVTVKRSLTGNVVTTAKMLNRGESYTTDLPSGVTGASVTATQPVTCYSYLTSGGNNQETIGYDPETLEDIKINWGNPTNAMIPSWNQRVKEMTFFTRALVPQSAVEPQHHFVQVVTAESDVDKVVLDGVPVDPIRFTAMAVNNYMAVANIELSTHGKHTISTSGSGLVGFVHGLTGGQAYQYTLGYCPDPYRDSLFITDDGVMSPHSYDLDPIPGKGNYQRQLSDWPEGEERLDTAYVCDSTVLHFSSQMADNYRNDSVVWHIYSYDPETNAKTLVRDSSVVAPDMLTQQLEHLFALDPEKDRTPEMRDPKQLFEVEYLMYRSHLVCEDLEPIVDTLMTMVEVHRQYRDTIMQRVICAGDSVRCFFDTGVTTDSIWWTRSHTDSENDSTAFVGHAPGTNRQEQYVLGDNLFTRKYPTIYGCDSIMMFYLHVCDTFLEYDTISFCEGDTLYYKNEKEFFYSNKPNQTFTGGIYRPGTYIDTLKTVQCQEYEAIDPTFHGCDSVRILTVLQCDTFFMPSTDVFCTNGEGKYSWREYTNIDETHPLMKPDTRMVIEEGVERLDTISWTGIFTDSLKRENMCEYCEKKCDSIYQLTLTIPNHYLRYSARTSICDSSYYDDGATYHFERNSFAWSGHMQDMDDPSQQRVLWLISKDGQTVNKPFHSSGLDTLSPGSYIIHDSLTSTHGCDSVWVLPLTINHALFHLYRHTMPSNETYYWPVNQHTYGPYPDETPEGTVFYYHDSLTTPAGCDDIHRLELKLARTYYFETFDTICDVGSLIWRDTVIIGNKYSLAPGETYDLQFAAGKYVVYDSLKTVPTPSRPSCDSVYALQLRVYPTYDYTVRKDICDHDELNFEGTLFKATDFPIAEGELEYQYDEWSIHRQAAYGCDSLIRLDLHIWRSYEQQDTIRLCQDTTAADLPWTGHKDITYSARHAGTFHYEDLNKTIDSNRALQCDSNYYLTVIVDTIYRFDTIASVCDNEFYHWQGRIYGPWHITTDSLILDTISYSTHRTNDLVGCDSTFYLQLRVLPTYKKTELVTICENEENWTYTWNQEDRDGTYQHVLSFDPIPAEDAKGEVKRDTTFHLIDTLHTAHGCDSIVTLKLLVHPIYRVEEDSSVCQYSNFVWKGHEGHTLYDENGQIVSLSTEQNGQFTYFDTLYTINGSCDSVRVLNLTVREVFQTTDPHAICRVDAPYVWEGHTDAAGHTYSFDRDTVLTDTLTSIQCGCDSIVTLQLTIFENENRSHTETLCTNAPEYYYPAHDRSFKADTLSPGRHTYIKRIVIGEGMCSYMDTLHLDIYQAYVGEMAVHRYDTICSDTATTHFYVWENRNLPIQTAGTYTYIDSTHTRTCMPCGEVGCDSVNILHLTVLPSYYLHFDHLMSDEEHYVWEGVDYGGVNYPGVADVTVTKDTLIVFKKPTEAVGNYQCDSIRYLHLRIGKVFRDTTHAVVCDNCTYTWIYRTQDGLSFDSIISGASLSQDTTLFYDSLKTSLGYDSIYVLSLYRAKTYSFLHRDTICQLSSYAWEGHDTVTISTEAYGPHTYYDRLKTEKYQCDSIWKLELYVAPIYTADVNRVEEEADILFGESYHWNGHDYTEAGIYHFDTLTALGCDSIVFLNLCVHYDYIQTVDTVCRDTTEHGFYIWHQDSISLAAAGMVTRQYDTITHTYGCDSIMHLQLCILPSYYADTVAMMSDEEYVRWEHEIIGGVRTEQVTGVVPTIIVHGNDSVLTRHYNTTTEGTLHCDSTREMHLRIGKVFRDTTFDYVCDNCSYTWTYRTQDGLSFDSIISGASLQQDTTLFYNNLKTSLGFDSVYVLSLYRAPTYSYVHKDTICQGAPYSWLGHDTVIISTEVEGSHNYYDRLKTQTYACDSIWKLDLYVAPTYDQNYHTAEVTDTISICDNDSVTWERRLYVGAKFTEYHGVALPSKAAHYDTLIYVTNDTLDYWTDTTAFGKAHPEYACDSMRFLDLRVSHITYDTLRVATICNNEDTTIGSDRYRFVWDHSFVLSAGDSHDSILVLYDTVQNAAGCDSVARLTLTVHPSYAFAVEYDTICQYGNNAGVDTTYTWFSLSPAGDSVAHQLQISTRHHGDFVYIDSLHTMNGCDSIHTLALHIDSVYHIYDDTAKISDEEFIVWEHQFYMGEQYLIAHPGAVVPDTAIVYHGDTLLIRPYESEAGCDSTRYLYIRVGKVFRDTTYDYTCDNCVYTWRTGNAHGWRPTQSGLDSTIWEGLPTQDTLILDKYETALGFDSIYYLSLHIVPSYRFLDSTAYACQEDTAYIWPRHESVHVSLLRDTVFDVKDSLRTYLVVPVRRYGSSEFVNERTACDSIWTLHMHVTPTYDRRFHTDEVTDLIPICDNDTLLWERRLYVGAKYQEYHGTTFPSKAAHYDTLIYVVNDTLDYWTDTTAFGKAHPEYACDSMRFLDLRVSHISYDTTLVQTICNNENLSFGSEAYHFEWDHRRVYYSDAIMGTDTTFQLFDTVQNAAGCDSVARMTLTIHPSYLIITDTTICGSDVAVFYWRQKNYRVSGTYDDTCHTAGWGCDSIYRLQLTVLPTFVYNTVENICEGDTIDFYGEPVYALPSDFGSGMVTRYVEAKLPNIQGCDNIYRLYPFFYRRYFFSDTIRLCDNETYTWTGHRHDTVLTPQPGYGQEVYYDSLMSHVSRLHPFYPDSMVRFGCDSVYELVLIHSSTFSFADTFHVCQYESFSWPNHTYKGEYATPHAGEHIYYDSLQTTMAHCDSVWTLHLMVDSVYIIDSVFTICDDESVLWQGRTYHLPAGEYTDTVRFSSTYHCDSLHTMKLTVYPTYTAVTDSQTICDSESYSFVGTIYPAFSWRTAHHTDTVLHLDTVIPSIHGCDSAVHHVLTVHPTYYYYDTTHVFCTGENYLWQGRTYLPDSACVIRDTASYLTRYGCDSIYYLRLIYHQSYFWNEDDTICADAGVYTWHQHTIHIDPRETNFWPSERTFIYYDSLVSVDGCDSVYRLQLTVQPLRYIEVDSTMCYGEYYTSPSGRYRWTESGLYRDTTFSAWGCHIFHTIRLTMLKPTRYIFSKPRACADLEYFSVPFSFVGTAPVSYSVFFDSLALSQLFYNQRSVALAPGDNHLEIDMPIPSSDRRQYVRPDHYTATIYMDNGICRDSALMTFPFSFDVQYPSWITEQHWNDAIGILVPELNGYDAVTHTGYSFSSYQWYRDGQILYGETKPYLYAPHGLTDAGTEYSVYLVREGETQGYFTCPLIPTSGASEVIPTMPYVSVVPTIVDHRRAEVNILSLNAGVYTIHTSYGVQVGYGRFVPDEHHAFAVRLPNTEGVYVFHLVEDSGLERNVKVIVQ